MFRVPKKPIALGPCCWMANNSCYQTNLSSNNVQNVVMQTIWTIVSCVKNEMSK